MPHKFKVGQLVDYYPPRGIYAPRGPYLIAAQLPKRDGEFEYHIRHPNEVHDRIVTESQLSIAQVTASSAEITEYMGYQLEARPLGKGWRVLIYPPRPRGGGANNTHNRDGYNAHSCSMLSPTLLYDPTYMPLFTFVTKFGGIL